MKSITRDEIRKITGKAPLNFDDKNKAFISFNFISSQAATAAMKKLKSEGYNVSKIDFDKRYLILK